MRPWAFLLGGLIVWTVHFFALYAIASIFLTSTTARLLTLFVTAACLAVDALLLWRILPRLRNGQEEVTHWMNLTAALAAALSFLAVLWQGLPALLI